jgi:hypothetical protein
MNAPNLEGIDGEKFLTDDMRAFSTEGRNAYKDEMKALLTHYLTECLEDGVDVPIIPGFGMGAFLPEHLRSEGFGAFGEALNEVLKESKFANFSRVVLADPNPELCKAVKEKNSDIKSKLTVTDKSGLDVVQKGMDRGLKMGFLNPGDPRCYPGENWEGGHFALEEMLGQQTTMVLAQHPGICPNVSESSSYVERKIR